MRRHRAKVKDQMTLFLPVFLFLYLFFYQRRISREISVAIRSIISHRRHQYKTLLIMDIIGSQLNLIVISLNQYRYCRCGWTELICRIRIRRLFVQEIEVSSKSSRKSFTLMYRNSIEAFLF